jgi:hypothetical protein
MNKDIKAVELFTRVKRIKETSDIEEVNKLVKENWILLGIASTKKGLVFSLGFLGQSISCDVKINDVPNCDIDKIASELASKLRKYSSNI